MARLRGQGIGAGMALGTAILVRTRSGIPLPPAMPERMAAEIAARRLTEVPEVVLVAPHYRIALALVDTIEWAKVAAIVAEAAEPGDITAPFPVVIAPGAMTAISEDVLVLVDADNSIVIPDPDPISLAHYTSIHARIAPRRRIYLDDVHHPAKTMDGRVISVLCRTGEKIAEAVEAGADALYVEIGVAFDPEDQEHDLTRVLTAAGATPIFLRFYPALSPAVLVEAAAHVDLILVVGPDGFPVPSGGDPDLLAQISRDLADANAECQEQERACRIPPIAGEVLYATEDLWPADPEQIEALVEALAQEGATRLLFTGNIATLPALRHFESLAAAGAANTIPVFGSIGETAEGEKMDLEASVRNLIGAGASGLILEDTAAIPRVKEAIRSLSASEAREELWLLLQGGEDA